MPYSTIEDLPQDIQDKYPLAAREAFLSAFNGFMDDCTLSPDKCEEGAFKRAYSAANRIRDSQGIKMLTLDNESKTLLQKFVGLFARKSNDLITGESGFKSLGNNKWIAWYTNAYLDKHNEIIATKAIEEDTNYMNESGNYPDLRFYHIKGSTHGKALWAGNIGRYGVAIGEYFTDETSQKFKTWAESNPVKLSHGFYYSPAYKDDNVFNKIRTFEISVLPEGKEANPYTSFNIYKEDSKMAMSEEQLQALKQIVGDVVAQQIVERTESITKSNDKKLVYKAEMIEEEEKEDVVIGEEEVTEESPEESSDALIKSMAKMVTEMYNLIKSAASESEPAQPVTTEIKSEDGETIESLKAEIATLKANQENKENQEFVLDLAEIMKDFNQESSPNLKYHPDILAGAKSLFGFEEKSN